MYKRNKYKAKKASFNGRVYDSGLEADHAANLDFLLKAGIVTDIKPQYKISLDINGVHIANYFIDFMVEFKDGRVEYHEVKGFETDLWRLKWRLTKAIYPDYNCVLLKQQNVKAYLKLNK